MFWELVQQALEKIPELSVNVRNSHKYSTLPRMCKFCAYLVKNEPPSSLVRAGVKPEYVCQRLNTTCFLAVDVCKLQRQGK